MDLTGSCNEAWIDLDFRVGSRLSNTLDKETTMIEAKGYSRELRDVNRASCCPLTRGLPTHAIII